MLCLAFLFLTCRSRSTERDAEADASASAPPTREPPPALLYLPDGSTPAADLPTVEPASLPRSGSPRCPPEMVDVAGRFCIDRYEITLIDERRQQALSPYYHPTPAQTRASYQRWRKDPNFASSLLLHKPEVPLPPPFQLDGPVEPLASVRLGVHPSGYLSQVVAAQACSKAKKRLCSSEEWVTACRGERDQPFPYGPSYEPGRCNVFRDAHPAALLHGNASVHHTDPRLNLLEHAGEPLLRRTGSSECPSVWGQDAVFDMVGNLDEWTADPDGVFRGGFYARATRAGCEAAISSHPPEYFDYSLGGRCCR